MAAYPSSDWLFTTEAGGPSATGGASGSGQKPVPVTWYAFAQALLRFGAHRRGRVGQAGAHRPRALLRVDHAADVRPPVAGDDDRTRLVIDTVLAGLVHGLRTAHPSADHSRRSRPETMPQPSWSPSSPAPLNTVGKWWQRPPTCGNTVDCGWSAVDSAERPADSRRTKQERPRPVL